MSYRLERARLDDATANKIRSLERELQCRVVALEAKVQFAELSHDQFVRLERMEKELGVSLVAYRATDYCQIASVPEQTLQRVQQLERDTGLVFIAYQHIHENPVPESTPSEAGYEPAALSEDQADRLQRSEAETNLVLMAYKKS
jgi:hypothetical protein